MVEKVVFRELTTGFGPLHQGLLVLVGASFVVAQPEKGSIKRNRGSERERINERNRIEENREAP